ncbi:MAG: AAA domain-containing protein, partial [Ignavibacteriales bacterium]
AAVDRAAKAFDDADAAAVTARAGREAVAAKADTAAVAAEQAIGLHQAHMHQLIGIKGKVLAALAPHGALEALAEAIPFLRSLFVHKRVARLCALAAQDRLIGELFEREARHNDPAAWAVRVDQVMQEAAAEMVRLRDAETEDARRRREELARADDALRSAVQARETTARKVEEAKASRQTRLGLLEGKINELYTRTSELRAGYDALLARAIADFRVKVPEERQSLELPTVADFDWLLDVTLRHMAFQKAMRYWEGRWIIEAEGIQDGNVNLKSGRLGMEARFRRWCMLTPCLVITLHSLPKHFRFTSRLGNDGAWVSNFMLDFIDLLIVDEAGQVGPHIGAAAFALASRAVVVGDIYQAEPVSRVSRGTDYGNCARLGLGSLWFDGDPTTPHLISEPSDGKPQGSIMRLAQSATSAVSPGTEKEPGIFLSEHRRCRSEIVKYCNRLIYNGRLEPLSPPRDKEPPLPPMAWAHIRGNATKKGGSNINPLEAQAIASWIAENAKAWCGERYYGKPIEEVVAVVTPFRPQARLVKAALERAGRQFAKVTVGTVHSLQGAEKPIVVFSPTYSADTAKGLFFDRKPNMLNVTVSRAKDSFVVIGDMRLFRRSGDWPSAILGSMLFADDQNELPDVDGNYRFPRELLVQGERISTLDRHREVLRAALTGATAGQVVVIASPWITMKAIEADGLAALVAGAVRERGAKVRIIVDRELSTRDPKHRAAEAIAEMKKAGAVVSTIGNMHNKTLIMGASEIVEGSFNWLSANRLREDRHVRHETSWRISGQAAISAVYSALEEFTKLGA